MKLRDMSIAPIAIMWYHGQPFKDTKGKDIRQPLAVRLDNQKQTCAVQIQKHQVHSMMKVSQQFFLFMLDATVRQVRDSNKHSRFLYLMLSEFVPEEPSAVVQEETSGDAILEAEQVMNLTTESSTRLITMRKLQTEICM